MSDDQASQPKNAGPPEVAFHYLKSQMFRVIHVDGVHGGLTPQLKVQMALFNERLPIPKTVVHNTTELEGGRLTLGKETDRTTLSGIVREGEVEVIMDIDIAKLLINWLSQRVEQAESLKAIASEEQGK